MKLMKEREIGMLLVEVGGCGRKLRKQREESVSQMEGKGMYIQQGKWEKRGGSMVGIGRWGIEAQ